MPVTAMFLLLMYASLFTAFELIMAVVTTILFLLVAVVGAAALYKLFMYLMGDKE
jgi:hypothetical protein